MSIYLDGGGPTPKPELTSEQRGNVTGVHREVLARLVAQGLSSWSEQALWTCLDQLRVSTITAAPEVCVEQAWTDGPAAFCVVYRPPYDAERLLGLRRESDDAATEYPIAELLPGWDPRSSAVPDPGEFGRIVADFHIGEPLGNNVFELRPDRDGVGWWETLQADLPSPTTDE